ncbi:hypothetical protein OG462_39250 [Streptomyces sp. NBC_01077]|uniref:hypothetical protein n=1 Tax=Streptomyces sp. NBC_01077 TaxID=2903746 RepID=UPI0038693B69|nr:hypothetical protein OG462_39250 [Streptomyces sp. NBC_01077]
MRRGLFTSTEVSPLSVVVHRPEERVKAAGDAGLVLEGGWDTTINQRLPQR